MIIVRFDILDTIFSHRDLRYGYRIADARRTRGILLLFFLVPTCHLSTPTFPISFFMAYYCGWWCRGSTHLQKWQQGWAAYYKTSWELWPTNEMGTYTDGELTEATDTIESNSSIWIIGYKNQNPRNVMSTHGLLPDLGLDQLQHPFRSWQI